MTLIRRAILALALAAGLAPAFAQAPAPVPALPDAERRTSYSITASTCNCAVGFALYGDSSDYTAWVEVWLNGVKIGQPGNWTLSSPSGPITSIARPISNAVITFTAPQTGTVQIVGARRPRRVSQFPENRGVAARDLNQALTDIISQNREIFDKVNDETGRALISQPGVSLGLLPLPALCAGKFISFDVTGLIPQCLPGAGSGNVVGPVSSGIGNIPSFANTTGSLLRDTGTLAAPVPTIAALRALTPPTTAVSIFVQGYSGIGDGGGGLLDYDPTSVLPDNGCTTFAPISAPATGRWQRNRVWATGNDVNVKWCGAKGDGVTSDVTAVAAAIAIAVNIGASVYFPASPGCYLTAVRIGDGVTALRLHGDSFHGATVSLSDPGSTICSGDSVATVQITGALSGNTSNTPLRDLKIANTGNGDALQINNSLYSDFYNLSLFAMGSGNSLSVTGSVANFYNIYTYGNTGRALKIAPSATTNSGPITFTGGQMAVQTGPGRAAEIVGDVLGLSFTGVQFSTVQTSGGTQTCSVTIDGDPASSNPPVGSVTFRSIHNESNFNFAGTLADICVGQTKKFGSVEIDGGNAWGHGDGTHTAQDFIRIFAARSVSVKNFIASNLGSTGYTRSMVRLESTFPAAGDTYTFQNNIADVTGAIYSDANGLLTGRIGDQTNSPSSFNSQFSLAGTVTPAALSGDVNDYNPTSLSTATALRIDGGASSRNITGIAGGVDGRLLNVINIGTTNSLVLKNESASSTAANRMTVGLDITIDTNKALLLRYDATAARWRPWDSIYSSVSVPISRLINTNSPLAGGGALSTDLTLGCPTCGVIGNSLSQFASTTSAQLAGVLSDETGTGVAVFATSPALAGTPTAPTAAAGTNTTQLATTAAIVAERAATKTLTNTTYDTAGTGNSFSINGLAATANTGTGSVVRATSPAITTPTGIVKGDVGLGNVDNTSDVTKWAATKTLTNTTYDTAGTGNSFSINGVAATANTGTGSVVRATSPTLVTPNVGVATATSINKMAVTAPATSSTLAVADGKTATISNTVTLTATDGVTVPFGTKTSQVFLSGSGTYTTPANVKYIEVRMAGGGGGGGGAGTSGGTGGTGGNTTFSTFTAAGGAGAAGASAGAGGSATGGYFNISGTNGSGGANVSPGWGSQGGGTPFGISPAASPNTAGGTGPTNSGAGGGGGGTNATNPTGGGGGSGGYMEFRIATPAATYTYAVGAAGGAGTAGTGGQAGGAGGAGVIIVNEFYQ